MPGRRACAKADVPDRYCARRMSGFVRGLRLGRDIPVVLRVGRPAWVVAAADARPQGRETLQISTSHGQGKAKTLSD
jgi:hypothetical protein